MRDHMLKYHVAVPLVVMALLVLIGVPLASAVRAGIAAGCMSMVLMMLTGDGHWQRHPHHAVDDRVDAANRR